MNFPVAVEFSAITLGFCSSVMFSVGVLNLRDSTLKTISESFWEGKSTLAKELAFQRVDFIFGAFLLGLSFLVQVAGKFLPLAAVPSAATSSLLCEALVGVGVPLILVALLWVPRSNLQKVAIERLKPTPKEATAQ